MAVTLTGTGGLFTRFGIFAYGIKSANLYSAVSTDISAGGLKAVGVTYTNVMAQFASALQDVPNGLFASITSVRSSLSQIKTDLATLAETALIEQVHADATLPSKTKEEAIKELIRQMANTDGSGTVFSPDNDVDAPTVSGSVGSAFTENGTAATGNGVVTVSVLRTDGRTSENVLAEAIEVKCTSSAADGATARSEVFSLTGETPVTDALAYNWPAGSGATGTLTTCDPALDADVNLLYNSDFDTFTTTNQPDYWGAALVGAYGTDILEEATVIYRSGGKSLEFIGTAGVPLSSIAQVFGVTTVAVGTSGTTSQLQPNTVYAVNCFIRKSAGLAAGNIEIRLLDSSNAVVNDDAGTANTLSIAHGAITTSFASFSGFFRTPKTVVPATTVLKLNVRVSTALTNTESVYIDDLSMCVATQAYAEGPYLAVFAGSTNFLKGDKFTVTIANNRAGEVQEWFERIFGMRALGLQLPSDTAGTETIADSLVG